MNPDKFVWQRKQKQGKAARSNKHQKKKKKKREKKQEGIIGDIQMQAQPVLIISTLLSVSKPRPEGFERHNQTNKKYQHLKQLVALRKLIG